MRNLQHQEISCYGYVLMGIHSLSLFSLTERGDYSGDCLRTFPLHYYLYGPEENLNISITIPPDNDALEGTEVFLLIPELFTRFGSDILGNIFFQHTSIQIRDTTGNYPS